MLSQPIARQQPLHFHMQTIKTKQVIYSERERVNEINECYIYPTQIRIKQLNCKKDNPTNSLVD